MRIDGDVRWASQPRTLLELAAVRACHPEEEADASLAERVERVEALLSGGAVVRAAPAAPAEKPAEKPSGSPAAPEKPAPKASAPAATPPQQYLDAIEKVGAENPSFRSMLPKMRYAGIEDGVVTVEFGRDGIMVRRVLESKAPLIEAALSEAFGQSMRLRTRNAGEQSAKTSAAAKSVIEQSYDVFGRDKIELTD